MKISQNLEMLKEEVVALYMKAFQESKFEAEKIIFEMVDLKQSFGLFVDDKLVSAICPVERTIYQENGICNTILNLTCLMTRSDMLQKGYAKQLILHVANLYVHQYDSIIWQAYNWDVYKSINLVPCTKKVYCKYLKGNYPTPMLITWDTPQIALIQAIEKESSNGLIGVERTTQQIAAHIEIYKNANIKFIANPGAYIWYDDKFTIIDMQYSNFANLIWLMHAIQPKGEFLLFDTSELIEWNCLEISDKYVDVIKTYAPSKKHFKNIKLIDFYI